MPSTKAQGLRDYNEVSERVAAFNEDYPEGRIETEIIQQQVEVYDVVERRRNDRPYLQPLARGFVTVQARAYRGADDQRPAGVGTSTMLIPGTTQYTRDSEVENAETSAVGRSLAMIGYYAKGSLASKQEISAKRGNEDGAGSAAGSRGNSSTRAATQSGSTGSPSAPDVVGRVGTLSEKQEKYLEVRMKEADITGDRRKAALFLITGKRSRNDLNQDDLDKLIAFLDARDSEENAEVLENIMIVSPKKTQAQG